MSGVGFLRVKKLKGGNIIAVAARHNKRELFEEGSIDPARTSLNEAIAGPRTADEVAALAKSLMAGAGIEKQRRKDATMGIEIVFSLPRITNSTTEHILQTAQQGRRVNSAGLITS